MICGDDLEFGSYWESMASSFPGPVSLGPGHAAPDHLSCGFSEASRLCGPPHVYEVILRAQVLSPAVPQTTCFLASCPQAHPIFCPIQDVKSMQGLCISAVMCFTSRICLVPLCCLNFSASVGKGASMCPSLAGLACDLSLVLSWEAGSWPGCLKRG